eukprot:CAMPEP_0119546608 /NCGR_PEP_ID=MMETSP1352-20130426/956_1 /TAXON_ID=265584 /ORGANISM="Stauroneis constricta, Strain CCMP1120" /LENGTH=223 /DNA_ID=CAMNT_0007591329 /DNA_START=54 /DNA_END=722 /DNA_ORIENTATION=-
MSQQAPNDPEMARLNSSSGSGGPSTTTGGSNVPASSSTSPINSANGTNAKATATATSSHWKDVMLPAIVFLIGWYVPKYMLPSEDFIQQREIPYQKTAAGDVLLDLELNNEAIEDMTIPPTLLIRTSVVLPMLLVAIVAWRKDKRDVPYAVSGLLLSIGVSEGCTQLIKLYVLRRRPNFYKLCQFSIETLKCMAPYRKVLEAQMSFPSGHSSISFSGMTYVVW